MSTRGSEAPAETSDCYRKPRLLRKYAQAVQFLHPLVTQPAPARASCKTGNACLQAQATFIEKYKKARLGKGQDGQDRSDTLISQKLRDKLHALFSHSRNPNPARTASETRALLLAFDFTEGEKHLFSKQTWKTSGSKGLSGVCEADLWFTGGLLDMEGSTWKPVKPARSSAQVAGASASGASPMSGVKLAGESSMSNLFGVDLAAFAKCCKPKRQRTSLGRP